MTRPSVAAALTAAALAGLLRYEQVSNAPQHQPPAVAAPAAPPAGSATGSAPPASAAPAAPATARPAASAPAPTAGVTARPAATAAPVPTAPPAAPAPTRAATPARSPAARPTATRTTAATTGHYTGVTDQTPYGPVQVEIWVSGSRITDVQALQLPSDTPRSQQISSYAGPKLRQEALAAQSANIDTVSGATYTSDGYRQSLQSAIDQAHLG